MGPGWRRESELRRVDEVAEGCSLQVRPCGCPPVQRPAREKELHRGRHWFRPSILVV